MLRIVLAYLVYSLVPVAFWLLLRAELPLLFILGLGWTKLSCRLLLQKSRGRLKKIMRFVSPLVSLLFAALILAGMLITPFSAYRIWFEAVREGAQKGVVSNLLVLLAAFLASAVNLFSGNIIQSLLILAIFSAGLPAIVYQLPLPFLILSSLLLAFVVYLSLSRTERKVRFRSLAGGLLLTVLVAALAFPVSRLAGIGGSPVVDRHLHPGLRSAVVTVFPRFPLLYGVPGFGFAFNEKRLGGTPVLSGSPIFEVEGKGGDPLYLKTQVFDFYDGKAWRSTAAQDGSAAQEERTAGRIEFAPAASFTPDLRIRLLLEYYYLLPHTLDTARIALEEADLTTLVQGNEQSSLSLSVPWRFGKEIYLERSRPVSPRPGLDSEQMARYLQVPESLPRRIKELAAVLAAADPVKLLGNIQYYLAANYVYTLRVSSPKPADDFVDNFLFSNGSGYCVHFASAMVLLARLNGVPARYVTGFLHYLPSGSGPTTISGLSAHAWPEIWIEGKGWQVWEATSALNPTYYDELDGLWFYPYSLQHDRRTMRQLSAILGRRPTQNLREQVQKKHQLQPALLLLLLLFPALALLIRFAVIFVPLYRRDRAAALRIMRRIVRSRALKGQLPPEEGGWVAWTQNARKKLPGLERRFARLLTLCLAVVYGQAHIRRRDIRFLFGFYRQLRR